MDWNAFWEFFITTVHEDAKVKGWHDKENNVGERIALMHSELSEFLEDWRKGIPIDDYYVDMDGKPHGPVVELADVIIRIVDFAGEHKLPLGKAIFSKMLYNRKRPWRHGGKIA